MTHRIWPYISRPRIRLDRVPSVPDEKPFQICICTDATRLTNRAVGLWPDKTNMFLETLRLVDTFYRLDVTGTENSVETAGRVYPDVRKRRCLKTVNVTNFLYDYSGWPTVEQNKNFKKIFVRRRYSRIRAADSAPPSVIAYRDRVCACAHHADNYICRLHELSGVHLTVSFVHPPARHRSVFVRLLTADLKCIRLHCFTDQ